MAPLCCIVIYIVICVTASMQEQRAQFSLSHFFVFFYIKSLYFTYLGIHIKQFFLILLCVQHTQHTHTHTPSLNLHADSEVWG